MEKQIFAIFCTLLLTLYAIGMAEEHNCTWIDGNDGFWHEAQKWSCGQVPNNTETDTFNVTIGSEQDLHIRISSLDNPNIVINRLMIESGGKLDLEKSTGRVDFNVIREGIFNYSRLSFSGDEDWSTKGSIYNDPNGYLEFSNPNDTEHEGPIINEGHLQLSPEVNLAIDSNDLINSGTIFILGGLLSINEGQLILQNNGMVHGMGLIHSDELIDNRGTIQATYGTLVVHTLGSFENNGIIQNNTGSSVNISAETGMFQNNGIIKINAAGAVTSSTDINNNTEDGQIQLLGGTISAPTITHYNWDPNNFLGVGSISGNLVLSTESKAKLRGCCNIYGNLQVDSDAELEVEDGTIYVHGDLTNNGTIQRPGGRVICYGNYIKGFQPEQSSVNNSISDHNMDGQVNVEDFADFAQNWLWHGLD